MKPPSYDGDRGKWNGPAKLTPGTECRKLNDVTGRNASWRLCPVGLSGNCHDWGLHVPARVGALLGRGAGAVGRQDRTGAVHAEIE